MKNRIETKKNKRKELKIGNLVIKRLYIFKFNMFDCTQYWKE